MLLLEKKGEKKENTKTKTKNTNPGHSFPALLFIALRTNTLQSLLMAHTSNSSRCGKVPVSPTFINPHSAPKFTCCRACPMAFPLEIIPPSPCPGGEHSLVTLPCPGAPGWSLAAQAPMLCRVSAGFAAHRSPGLGILSAPREVSTDTIRKR